MEEKKTETALERYKRVSRNFMIAAIVVAALSALMWGTYKQKQIDALYGYDSEYSTSANYELRSIQAGVAISESGLGISAVGFSLSSIFWAGSSLLIAYKES